MGNFQPERLKNARESLGITKAEASRRCGLSKIGYSRYESGEREPSPQMIEILSYRLQTSVSYLTGRSEAMDRDSVVIMKNDRPLLFELTLECMSRDEKMTERLLNYYYAINKRSSIS